LYGGPLKWAHCEDIPYVPHIIVAAGSDLSRCEALAATLAGGLRDMHGSVEALSVVEMTGATVAEVAQLALEGGT
jgi:hypothetical protein